MNLEIDLKNAIDHTTADNFSKLLFELVFKANKNNIELLRVGFPQEVAMVEHYRKTGDIELVKLLDEPTLTPEERKAMADSYGLQEEEVSQSMTEMGLDFARQHITILSSMINNVMKTQILDSNNKGDIKTRVFETMGQSVSMSLHGLPIDLVDSILESSKDVCREAKKRGIR